MTRTHPYYPLFLDLEGREALIVGGGPVSVRKIESLLRAGATVTVVSPACAAAIETWSREGVVTLRRRRYEPADLGNAALVVAATDNPAVNAQVARDARAQRIPVNVIDDPAAGDFIVPAVVERGSIQIAVSTGGQSPAFARLVRQDLEELIGPEYGEVNDILGSLREAAKSSPALPEDPDRRQFFAELLGLDLVGLLRAGRRLDAYRSVADLCARRGVALSDLIQAGLRA